MVAGLIAVGGSCHDWQGFGLEVLAATMFTNSVQVVDQYMVTRVGRPGNICQRQDHLDRVHKMGENIIKAINTPVEERGWLGDPDLGLCPNCHGGLVFRGDVHWDGLQFPYECAVCGAGLELVDGKFKVCENGLCRDRNVDEARGYHLEEIISTRVDFFKEMDTNPDLKAKIASYKDVKFASI